MGGTSGHRGTGILLSVIAREARGRHLGIKSESASRHDSLQQGNLYGKLEPLSHLFVMVEFPQ